VDGRKSDTVEDEWREDDIFSFFFWRYAFTALCSMAKYTGVMSPCDGFKLFMFRFKKVNALARA
jgi:hypothetical protein